MNSSVLFYRKHSSKLEIKYSFSQEIVDNFQTIEPELCSEQSSRLRFIVLDMEDNCVKFFRELGKMCNSQSETLMN